MKRTAMRRVGPRGRARAARLRALRPAVLARWDNQCANPWCMLTGELDVDHVQKRWHGAQTDRLENLIPLCRWCHAAKDHGSGKGIKLRVSAERPKGRHGEAEQFNGFWFWWV